MALSFSRTDQFLVSTVAVNEGKLERSISLEHDFDVVKQNWGGTSRASTVWSLSDETFFQTSKSIHSTGFMVFAGPINPDKLVTHFGPRIHSELPSLRAFCSLGFMNLVLSLEREHEAQIVLGFLSDLAVPTELWEVADGIVTKETPMGRHVGVSETSIRDAINKLASPPFKGFELKAKQEEFALSAMTASCRGKPYGEWIETEANLVLASFNEALSLAWEAEEEARIALEEAEKSQKASDVDDAFRLAEAAAENWSQLYYSLTNVTSGYSRFLAQALVGISPIGSLECNFGPHSLLGVGLSSQALRNTVDFISQTLGGYKLVERFSELSSIPFTGKLPQNLTSDQILDADILGQIDEKELGKYGESVPTICYFSARDIFKHDLYTISVPIDTLYAANTLKWSLHTITHEMSHRFVEPILALLFPTTADDLLAEDGKLLQRPAYKPKTWEEAAKQFYFQAMHAYAENSEGQKVVDAYENNDEKELFEILQHHEDEVQEFIVHTLDFLYFYSLDAPKYIESIWRSWLALPGVEKKIDDYIIRTVVALSVDNLHLTDNIEASRQQLERTFTDKIFDENVPIHKAILRKISLDKEISPEKFWQENLYPRAYAGNFSARFCRIFLYSEDAAKRVAIPDKFEASGSKAKGYKLEDKSILNPLTFLSDYADSSETDHATSAWVFYNLAFNLKGAK
jgi:hypothetical protein